MRKVRDVLRLHYWERYSLRATARCLSISVSTVSDYINRAKGTQLGWPLPEELTDAELQARLFRKPTEAAARPVPDWRSVRQEVARKGVTLYKVWEKYRESEPEGYRYTRFCELFNAWRKSSEVVMRLQHKAGKTLYVDYAGQSVPIIDPDTGEVTRARIFCSHLGYSSYTYVEATADQKLHNWGLAKLTSLQERDLFELLDDRQQRSSTIATSQLPLNLWHESMENPTLADAILDRLIHNAHQIALKGDSIYLAKMADVTEQNDPPQC